MTVFKIGDKARIRKDLKDGVFYNTCTVSSCYCNFPMTQYAGTAVMVAGKNADNGYMDLRTIGDGASRKLPWNWSDEMLEPIEEEKKPASRGFLDVCAVVKIRSDIAKRVDKKNRIWITLNGKKCPSFPVSEQIKESGGKVVVITEVLPRPGHMDGFAYRARFAGGENITGLFDITMFDCLEDWLVKIGKTPSDDKPDQPKKQPPKRRKKPDSAADYSGYTPKSEFYCYDYLNRPAVFSKNAMENITKIEVTVMSGDETGCFYGVYNGKPWKYGFDTMTTSRFQSYDDGSYTVEGKENIEKWINWSYDPEKAIYAEYSMERMRAFKGC